MASRALTFLALILGCAWAAAAPANELENTKKEASLQAGLEEEIDDLKTAASTTYTRRYSDYGSYPSGSSNYYGVSGYGSLDNSYNGNGYDNTYGYNGYNSGNSGYGGYGGYNSGYGGYSSTGSGYGKYGGGYGLTGYGSNGGYGGWGGNGGLNSYYGYNNPYYQGSYNTGYGYYNRRPGVGYGNIYNNGITPSLVTGYRGYSRR